MAWRIVGVLLALALGAAAIAVSITVIDRQELTLETPVTPAPQPESSEIRESSAACSTSDERRDASRIEGPLAVATRELENDAETSCLDFAAFVAARGVELGEVREFHGTVFCGPDRSPCAAAELAVHLRGSTTPPGVNWDDEIEGRSDAHGRFVVRTPYEVTVTAHAPGFGWEGVDCGGGTTTDEELAIELEPALLLEGRVLEADGTPVGGGMLGVIGLEKPYGFVRFVCGNGWHAFQHSLGNTDQQGHFGPVLCYARGAAAIVLLRGRAGEHLFPSIALDGAPGATRFVELRLPPRVVVSGRVAHADGLPSIEVEVEATRCFDHWSDRRRSTEVDDDGSYELELPAAGPYRLEVIRVGDERDVVAACDRVVSIGTTVFDFVVSTRAPPADDGNARLDEDDERDREPEGDDDAPALGSIEGRALCECVRCEESEIEVLLLRDGIVVDCESSDAFGNFEFEDVEPGRYDVMPLGQGHERAGPVDVDVLAGEATVLAEWNLRAIAHWRGRLLTTQEAPVEDATVRLEPMAAVAGVEIPSYDVSSTEADGGFRLASLDEPCRLVVARDGAPPIVLSLERTPRDGDLVVHVPKLRSLSGRLAVPGGVPSRDLSILCEADDGSELAEVVVGADGRFLVSPITNESFDVVLLRQTANHFSSEVARRRAPAGELDLDFGVWNLGAGR